MLSFETPIPGIHTLLVGGKEGWAGGLGGTLLTDSVITRHQISSSVQSSCFQTGLVEQTAVVTVHPVQLVHQLGEYTISFKQLNPKSLVKFKAYLTVYKRGIWERTDNFE